jgi:hypothetical protein
MKLGIKWKCLIVNFTSIADSDTQSDGTNSSGEEQRSPSKIRSNPPSPLALKKADSHDSKGKPLLLTSNWNHLYLIVLDKNWT